ncbi:MAG: 23S rRNA (pseudouridine(1915)-N(3))-methyltransferase RlmH [Firmicutes bacterium]|nr:23S rRNA (pseudouridine(1915)-N(3))-methyltransferase RlmH [Bacillota bacterium]
MRVQIIAVGKLKEKYLHDGMAEYLKRLTPYARVEIIEVPDEKIPDRVSPAQEDQVREKEAERILKQIKPDSLVIPLAIAGRACTSEQFAHLLRDLEQRGHGEITFIIGGSLGLSPRVLARGHFLLSFSTMTFPHQLMRLILIEQIYRAFKIIRGEPYHR